MFDRLIPFLSSLVIFAGWESIIFFPSYFSVIAPILILSFFVLLLKLNKFRVKDKDFWLLLTPGFFLVVLFTVWLLFLSAGYLQQITVILVTAASYYFTSYLYYFLCRITNYTSLSLEKTSSYFSVINYILLSVSLYGFINLLNLKLWYSALAVIAVTFILCYQFFWINKIDERHNFFACIVICLLSTEFFWAISFLPVSHFISGLTMGIIYYVVVNLTLAHFLEKLDKKIVRWYLSVGLICLFALLLSARWL
ncbi:hypothetical protein COU00_01005 [Candidatus Falkowbacteria bacterium CG10_big_fil_rev_8_21_14_0_10_43_11]|uniref:Uncharacterized protein n=1 Tax=Candidatus Falkowbacteria bacterium CG10_big_fil_rev_8_21_14_0_10_43_11 TaxID=1974568 RepID=A0A2M6WMM2_9BACT|nr:MAG: hypothetical protein COU00_01005 [Candidatus Falkowbacteria bacterium CG10_big_fil_rev_8_21_14_0_10_43_11]